MPEEQPVPAWGSEHVSPFVVLTLGVLVTSGDPLHVPADVARLLAAPTK